MHSARRTLELVRGLRVDGYRDAWRRRIATRHSQILVPQNPRPIRREPATDGTRMLRRVLDAMAVVLERIPHLLPRGIRIAKRIVPVEDPAVGRLVNVLQRRARLVALAHLELRLEP